MDNLPPKLLSTLFGPDVDAEQVAQLTAVFNNRVIDAAINALPAEAREPCRVCARAGDGAGVKRMLDEHGVDARLIAARIRDDILEGLSDALKQELT